VFRADDREVAAIQRGDHIEAESFGERHDGWTKETKGSHLRPARWTKRRPGSITQVKHCDAAARH
jgi:hypothetical protein